MMCGTAHRCGIVRRRSWWTVVVCLPVLLGHQVWAAPAKRADSRGKTVASHVRMPVLVHWVQAPYPPKAFAAGIQGKVLLHVEIDKTGHVIGAKVVRPAGHGFDEAAVAAVLKFRFKPAFYDGKPIRVKIAVLYPFVIRTVSRPAARSRANGRASQARSGSPEARRPAGAAPVSPARVAARRGAGSAPAARANSGRNRMPGPRGQATLPDRGPSSAPGARGPRGSEQRIGAPIHGVSRPRPAGAARAMLARLIGWAVERGTRDPIEDAECVAMMAGRGEVARTYSNEKGRFRFQGLPPGRYVIRVLSAGYRSFSTHETLRAGSRVTVRYYLERREVRLYETVVIGKAKREEVSRHVVALPEIQRIPGTQGDALRSIQNMPGVARASFGSGALIVRGSAPGDTQVLLHGHPIPLLYHFAGLTSVINSDILSHITFIPGNFSVRYGGAMGGIIDVATRKGKRRWHGYVDMDLWDVGLLLEGPLSKGSFVVTARRSYIDAVLGLLPVKKFGIGFSSAPVYYDYQAMVDEPVGGGHLKVLALGVDDRLKVLFDEPMDIAPTASGAKAAIMFHRVFALWDRRWAGLKVSSSVSAGFSRVAANMGSLLKMTFNDADVVWRGEATRTFASWFDLTFGMDGSFHYMWADVTLPNMSQGSEGQEPLGARESTHVRGSRNYFGQALFIEGALRFFKKLVIVPGVRLDYTKTLSFSRASFDPRISATWTVYPAVDIKAAVGLFHQPPGLADLWPTVGGNPNVGYERALHVSAGVEWRAPGGVTISGTGFYKHLMNLIGSSYDLVIRDGAITSENKANRGKGRVYGMELLVKKPLKGMCPHMFGIRRCFGWISYTLMRSERKDSPSVVNGHLPSGAGGTGWRPFDWDQTHILTMVLTVMFKRNWEFGVRFRYATGNPTTPVLGGIYDADSDTYLPVFGVVNSARIPAFHQLDIRVDKQWIFRTWKLRLYLDVQNAYNRQNPEFVMYNFNDTRHQYMPGLPIIPSLGLKGEF